MKPKPTKKPAKRRKNKVFNPKQIRDTCNQDQGLQVCGTQPRRRSIPTAEVDEMLEQQAKELRKEPTLYDQRVETLASVEFLSNRCDALAESLNSTQLELASERNKLKDLNRLLKEELQFDQVR